MAGPVSLSIHQQSERSFAQTPSPHLPLGGYPSNTKLGVPEGGARSEENLQCPGPSSREQRLQAQPWPAVDTDRTELPGSLPCLFQLPDNFRQSRPQPHPQHFPSLSTQLSGSRSCQKGVGTSEALLPDLRFRSPPAPYYHPTGAED